MKTSAAPTSALAALSGLRLPIGLHFEEEAAAGGGGTTGTGTTTTSTGAPPVNVKVNIDKEFIDKLVGENKGMNLNTTVKVNGKDVPLTELIGKAQQVDALQAQVGELSTIKQNLAEAYATGDKLDIGKAKTAMTSVLKTAGWTDDQVKEEIDAVYGEAERQAAAKGSTGTGGKGAQQEPENLQYKALVEQLNERIELAATDPFNSHPMLKGIMEAKTRVLNDELQSMARAGASADELQKAKAEHDVFVKEWKDQALADLNQRLFARKNKEKTFSTKWIGEEAAKTADTIASKLRRATGDPRFLGKAPATAAESPYSVLNTKPVERPKAEFGKTNVGDLDSKLDSYGTDRIMRAIAEKELATSI